MLHPGVDGQQDQRSHAPRVVAQSEAQELRHLVAPEEGLRVLGTVAGLAIHERLLRLGLGRPDRDEALIDLYALFALSHPSWTSRHIPGRPG